MKKNNNKDWKISKEQQDFFNSLKNKFKSSSEHYKNNNTFRFTKSSDFSNSIFGLNLNSLIVEKESLQFDIDNLKSKMSKLAESVKIALSKGSLSKIITQEELIEIKKLKCLIKDIEYLKIKNKLLKAITKIINELLNSFKNILRNLKEKYTKQHSFHFKNLDDYHSLVLNLTSF